MYMTLLFFLMKISERGSLIMYALALWVNLSPPEGKLEPSVSPFCMTSLFNSSLGYIFKLFL